MKYNLLKITSVSTLLLTLAVVAQPALAHNGENHMAMADTNTSMATTSYNGVEIQVMTHLCNDSVKNISDFQALGNNKDVVGAFANGVLNCPTTGLPKDAATPGTVASPRTMYDFSVTGEHHPSLMLSTNGEFMQHKVSEADVNKDVDGNGTISSSTALDISHYNFAHVMADNGRVEVMQTQSPAGYHFGTLLFTPTVIDGNNDKDTLISFDPVQGRIQLDTSKDKDHSIMLHVYEFKNNPSNSNTGTTTGTTTDRMMIISQINSLQQQISALFAQIKDLLAKL